MKQDFYEITENKQIAPSVFKMVLAGDTSPITAPGQFVNIKIPEFYLRRPISICDWNSNTLTIIYKAVGDGTRAFGRIKRRKIRSFNIPRQRVRYLAFGR